MVRAGRKNASKICSLWSVREEQTLQKCFRYGQREQKKQKNSLRNRSAQKFENCDLRNRNAQLFDVAKSQRSIIVTLPINVTLLLQVLQDTGTWRRD